MLSHGSPTQTESCSCASGFVFYQSEKNMKSRQLSREDGMCAFVSLLMLRLIYLDIKILSLKK